MDKVQPELFTKDGMTDEDVSAFVAATLRMKPQTEGFTFKRATRYMTHFMRGLRHLGETENGNTDEQ